MARTLERGEYAGVPYAAIGAGLPLVVLPGLLPMTGVDSDKLVWGSIAPVRALADRRRIVLLNRWPGLPSKLTMADIASRQADAIREAFAGQPAQLLGMSTGGSIAQQLAADHPDVVARLALLSTACRLGPRGRREQARIAQLLRAGETRAACRSAGASLVPRPLKPLGAAVGWLAAKRVFGSARDISDLRATLDAEDSFDLARCRATIQVPTLIVAGSRDRFYSRELFEQTQQLIPHSRLYVRRRRGHVTVTFDPKAVAAIHGFLTG